MKTEISYKDVFAEAAKYNKNGEYFHAISSLLVLLIEYIRNGKDKNIHIILNHIGINYYDMKDYRNGLLYSGLALELNSSYELASLQKYLMLVDSNRYEEAIQEMFHFLKKNEANLYKTTIKELLEGLEEGYMLDYEIEINKLASKYNIQL